ncbi:hypothetical protein [Pseudalkalibacillus decolorationis]|uniref:hypothetical protein n=1 Tax=Pseudalkalibacillus decolorationis TaxID=163879 RepID=UPI0021473CDB|nr:hypothetical protein [Pseudalkalibacillus decolorationis]
MGYKSWMWIGTILLLLGIYVFMINDGPDKEVSTIVDDDDYSSAEEKRALAEQEVTDTFTDETSEPVTVEMDTDDDVNTNVMYMNGDQWNSLTDNQKFHGISNLMYELSESQGWTFEFTESEYIEVINSHFSNPDYSEHEVGAIFITIKTLEDSQ